MSTAAIIGIIFAVIAPLCVATCGLGVLVALTVDEEAGEVDTESLVGWAHLPQTAGPIARPADLPNTPGRRLLIFSASWCPACEAAVLSDAAIAERFAGEIEVGIALSEDDEDFVQSSMSRWVGDTPVWSQSSTRKVHERCGVTYLPSACLVDGDSVVWAGEAHDAPAIVDRYLSDDPDVLVEPMSPLPDELDLSIADNRTRVRDALAGYAGRENTIAWDIADDPSSSSGELELAVALAEDAATTTGGLDYALLDTYALALSRSGRTDDAFVVSERVLALCDLLDASCFEERTRAREVIAKAGG